MGCIDVCCILPDKGKRENVKRMAKLFRDWDDEEEDAHLNRKVNKRAIRDLYDRKD